MTLALLCVNSTETVKPDRENQPHEDKQIFSRHEWGEVFVFVQIWSKADECECLFRYFYVKKGLRTINILTFVAIWTKINSDTLIS